MFYIYILNSPAYDKYYVGYSRDYNQRLLTHNASAGNTYTSKYRPWELKAVYEVGNDERDAVRFERFIKKQKSRKFLLRMISGEEFYGELAQLVRVPHVRD